MFWFYPWAMDPTVLSNFSPIPDPALRKKNISSISDMKFCPNCGQEDSEFAKRCLACREELPQLDLEPKDQPILTKVNEGTSVLAWAIVVVIGVIAFVAFVLWLVSEVEAIKKRFGW
jgi:hypothetical protein